MCFFFFPVVVGAVVVGAETVGEAVVVVSVEPPFSPVWMRMMKTVAAPKKASGARSRAAQTRRGES
jgi:hypothetical protein